MKKDGKWSTLQIVFSVMCVNGLFSRGHAIDATHAHRAALFHLAVSVAGLIGLVWTQSARKRAATLAPDGVSPVNSLSATNAPHASVTYNSTRADRWRCNLYFMFGRWQTLLTVSIFPLLMTFLVYVPLLRTRPTSVVATLLVLWAGWYAFLLAVIWAQILKAVPRNGGARVCQSVLRADGFVVITPEQSAFYRWADATELREHDGDLYFWRGFGAGSYVPIAAFGGDRQAARAYFQLAQDAWQGRDVQWPERARPSAIPDDPTVWPPPPQRF